MTFGDRYIAAPRSVSRPSEVERAGSASEGVTFGDGYIAAPWSVPRPSDAKRRKAADEENSSKRGEELCERRPEKKKKVAEK